MVRQQAQATTTLQDAATQASSDAKADLRHLNDLTDFLRQYTPSANQRLPDILENRYKIELTSRLADYDRKSAKVYAATDNTNPNRTLIALVCERETIQRQRIVKSLKGLNHPYILPLVAAGNVHLSQLNDERFVIIYERPKGKKLSELLKATQGRINPNFLIKNILTPLISALQRFSELDIAHGCVHPDNIFFNDMAVLGDCISEPCGHSQQFYFEQVGRMQAYPAAKGEGAPAQDYYALAVLALYVLHGEKYFNDLTPHRLANRILKEGAYNALTRNEEIPTVFYDFFRGILTPNMKDSWDYRQLLPWLEGKRYNVLPPPTPLEAIRSFQYNGIEVNTRKQLADALYSDWKNIPRILADGQLNNWVTISLRSKELSDAVTRITKNILGAGAKNEVQLYEQLMQLLLILDPAGPVRLGPLCFNIDGMDAFCADLYVRKADKDLQLLVKFIELGMISSWLEQQRKEAEYTMPAAVNALYTRVEKLRMCIRNTSIGFGLERMLYDLCPEMPCLSPLLAKHRVTTLAELLNALDQIAANVKDQEPLDRHIAAFIASKLAINSEIRLFEMEMMPILKDHKGILALKLLAMAQHKAGSAPLPGLTHWLAVRIMPALENIKSRTLRSHIKALLVENAHSGYTQLMAKLIVSASYPSADQEGFHKAWRLYNHNAARIIYYKKGESIEQHSARLGTIISQLLAYLVFFVMLWNVARYAQ